MGGRVARCDRVMCGVLVLVTVASVLVSVSSACAPVSEGARPRRMAPEDFLENNNSSLEHDKGSGLGDTMQMVMVRKCCPIGQNLSSEPSADGSRYCTPSSLPFSPDFKAVNESGFFDYKINEYETIVDNPCLYGKYLLNPAEEFKDEFHLLSNGSLFVPYSNTPMLGPREFCMDAFSSEGGPVTLPLVCFKKQETAPARNGLWLFTISFLMLTSVPFLVATSATYGLVEEVWKLRGRRHAGALAAHCGCLALAFFSLSITQLASQHLPPIMCQIAAHTIQLTFLASFFWLNLLCVDTYLKITQRPEVGETRVARWLWDLWGWGVPITIALITLLMERVPGLPLSFHKPNFGASGCWFQSEVSTLAYFYGFVFLLLTCNTVLFVLCARSLARQAKELMRPTPPHETQLGRETSVEAYRHYQQVFRLCFVLFLVMGLSWTLELVSWLLWSSSPIWHFSDLVNALQGLIIFYIFMRQPVYGIAWTSFTNWLPWNGASSATSHHSIVRSDVTSFCNGITNGNGHPPTAV